MTDADTDIVDPHALFMQFAPDLYFDAPKQSNGDPAFRTVADVEEMWYTVAEQSVPTSILPFWKTIKTWTNEPHLLIPPVEKAEILSMTATASNDNDQIIRRKLIPKRKAKDAPLAEDVEYHGYNGDKSRGRVIYRPVVPPEKTVETTLPFYYPKVKAYSFVYDATCLPRSQDNDDDDGDHDRNIEIQGTLRLQILPIDDHQPAITDVKMQYALRTILHKLFKWCIQTRLGYQKRAQHDTLVPKETYVNMYQHLKAKYASDLVSNWTEKTDPQKFVFEDIAIASYLICLWQQEERKPTFVDLGCGNGLLTYLLTSEGYQGYGIDVAERKIWAKLRNGKHDQLRVEALYPAQAVYPGTDWLIGNHADELVPWIPLMAAKSGAQCKFMVIPCCFYGLDGTKRLVLNTSANDSDSSRDKEEEEEKKKKKMTGGGSGGGKYKAYTRYVKDIATQCGFQVEQDHLRIPSTKNIAVVGRKRLDPSLASSADRMAAAIRAIETAGSAFVPRKNDRDKELERRERKRSKIEKSTT
ncbi:hypothetical protein BDB00DRAFT_795015 [Zychaea mexicana]|uniref:uncharacterized protein n=1 Tax=Zychaea mexicana TaxID=64656 RepID=UPI0022FE4820|nr:uncharacterized protein BDB00DRAFT_795015 [Zychaea mexicana]KAI9499658.1 hypothetical protein BDB00DRAFT_795015 [Zychaea mexicana]